MTIKHKGEVLTIRADGFEVLISYETVVAVRTPRRVVLDKKYWDVSRTTAKHVGQFVGESSKVIRERIKLGVIGLDDLQSYDNIMRLYRGDK